MKKIILITISILLLICFHTNAYEDPYKSDLNLSYVFSATYYRNGTLKLESINIINHKPSDRIGLNNGDFKTEIIDKKGKVLETFHLKYPLNEGTVPAAEWFDEEGNFIGPLMEFPNHTKRTYYLPYYRNASKLIVYDAEDKVLLNVDLSEISSCNFNNVCDASAKESYLVCPEDCEPWANDGYCNAKPDKHCDLDCEEEYNEEPHWSNHDRNCDPAILRITVLDEEGLPIQNSTVIVTDSTDKLRELTNATGNVILELLDLENFQRDVQIVSYKNSFSKRVVNKTVMNGGDLIQLIKLEKEPGKIWEQLPPSDVEPINTTLIVTAIIILFIGAISYVVTRWIKRK
ncbi:hypothetical protein ACFL0W_02410 [Nanoarchaeota archaeon]